jgi:undecaprenyl diphosphate synthase
MQNSQKRHVALIMDGNGRWAQARGWPRTAGHRAGADAVRRVIEAAPDLGIGTLTLYAFSADNWQRPAKEVATLMKLFRLYLYKETANCLKNGVRISVIGRRDRLDPALVTLIEAAEQTTRHCRTLHVRVAVDYSARESILRAVQLFGASAAAAQPLEREQFAALLGQAIHADTPAPDVDLLIRTSGEQRLSDFLLWECAYAELYFTACHWPDFDRHQLAQALASFSQRERRYGGLAVAASG